MTDLRAKLRPFVTAIVEQLVDEAVERIETTARDRLRAALEPPPIAHRDVKPANKRKRKPPRKVKRSKAARRHPYADLDRRDFEASGPKRAKKFPPIRAKHRTETTADSAKTSKPVERSAPQNIPAPARPCGCNLRGPHRKACSFGELKRDAAQGYDAARGFEHDNTPDEAPEYSPPSPAARADRFAKIEASAQKRTGTLPATSATFTTDGRL